MFLIFSLKSRYIQQKSNPNIWQSEFWIWKIPPVQFHISVSSENFILNCLEGHKFASLTYQDEDSANTSVYLRLIIFILPQSFWISNLNILFQLYPYLFGSVYLEIKHI